MLNKYNRGIIPQLLDYINQLLIRVEASDNSGASIKIVKYNQIDSNNLNIHYLVSHGMTSSFTLKLYFKVTSDSDGEIEFDEDLEIPMMVSNVFVIEGSIMVPTNTLDNDNAMTVYTNNIRVNEMLDIHFEEDEHEDGGYLITAYIYEDEEPKVIKCTPEDILANKDYFELEQFEIDKLKVKLDTDDIGGYLTRDLILKLIEKGSDKKYDNMIDKKIYSPESNLMKYMWSRDVRRKILTNIKSKFFQYRRIYLRDIQTALNKYFKTPSSKNIDYGKSINPLAFEAMKYKVTIPKNVAYNSTMTDIIDVANTPAHNQNANHLNELNVCAEIIDDVIHIKCYRYPSMEPVTVPYTSYCTKRVLMNKYWDYDSKQIKPDSDGRIRYKLRMKVLHGSPSDSFDFIEPKADDKLSITSRRIPLGNMSDMVRVAMATSMQKQALELDGSEPSLVTAGYDDTDSELSTLTIRYNGDEGEVTKIKDNKIFIKSPDGSVEFIEIPTPTPGQNDSIISFDNMVQVGQKLSKNDVVILPHMARRKSFELGVNSNVIYMNYLGYTYEDGHVISKSFARKLTHFAIIDVYQEIYPDDIIKYIKKVGSKVTSRDILVNDQTRLRLSQGLQDSLDSNGGLLRGTGISFHQSNLLCPNNIDEGYILDCRIEIGEDRELTSEETKATIEKYTQEGKSTDYDHIPDKYKDLKANTVELRDRVTGYISFKILKVDECKIGDKVANRYGGKGIVSLVLPDECMPRIERSDGTKIIADVILNPHGVLHRKNISQIWEASIAKCVLEIFKRVDEMIKSDQLDRAREFLSNFYSKFNNMSTSELKEYHEKNGLYGYRMEVGFYAKVNKEMLDKWMKILNLHETDRVYCPSITIVEDPKIGLTAYPLGTYQPQQGVDHTDYELGYCEEECVTGNGYIMKLFHSAAYSGKATPNIFDIPEPVMGRGNYRTAGGQSIGEMELWVLLATGSDEFLRTQSPDLMTNQYVFLNELLLAGYYIEDTKKNPLLSQARSTQVALEELDNK